MNHDVIIIGGSYAGLAAALQLVRARKSVLIIDAGQRRNRFASHSHGFLGQDGVEPAVIARTARDEVEAYPTATFVEDMAVAISGEKDQFSVLTKAGENYRGRRILLATGVADELPPIDGLAERWGQSVFHCPYCHGYELNEGQIGVIATGEMSTHQAELLTEWGQVTLLVNGAFALDATARRSLEDMGAVIEETPIDKITGVADVHLTDGRVLSFAGMFTASRCSPSTPLAEDAGCALEETMMGIQIQTNETKETSVTGIFACGDTARIPHSVSLAVGDAAMAGVMVHRSLVWP
ncbi:NAD(P)/FAD-dependent oxidoreductase [Ahrensia kielensis]|uniref:Thioredoxin reductase n=1 Tax=Ahrensia kielensis TaxID=76980 RepID=A0ABU9T8F6_9HYPH